MAGQFDQFDLDGAWALSPQVAVRPEPFGALMYHFGTRGLTFVKNPTMLAVVQGLAEAPSARCAAQDAGVSEAALPVYAEALARLARLQMIQPRAGQASPRAGQASPRAGQASPRLGKACAEGSVHEHTTR